MRQFGEKLRQRIEAAGFSSIRNLLKPVGINHSFVLDIESGKSRDPAITRIATIAILLGLRPSELMADIEQHLLEPKSLTAAEFRKLEIPGEIGDHDTFRLAVVTDVVLGWDEETRAGREPEELGRTIGRLYDALVRPDPAISTLNLRRRAMLDLFQIDLPEVSKKPRGRGRPAKSAAA